MNFMKKELGTTFGWWRASYNDESGSVGLENSTSRKSLNKVGETVGLKVG